MISEVKIFKFENVQKLNEAMKAVNDQFAHSARHSEGMLQVTLGREEITTATEIVRQKGGVLFVPPVAVENKRR